MSLTKPPRAVRNCNPGNLEAGLPWLGLATLPEMNSWQRAEQRFCVFRTAAFGFRALALNLYNSWRAGRRTVRELITRFAPTNENDTTAYIRAVCDGMGVEPDELLDLANPEQLTALCRAIAVHESGGWFFPDGDLTRGVEMALTSRPNVSPKAVTQAA